MRHFTAALFSGCSNKRLLVMTQMLATESAVYRRWSPPFESITMSLRSMQHSSRQRSSAKRIEPPIF